MAREHQAQRQKLPVTRNSITHKFQVGDTEGYVIVGLYEDKMPGELFITIAKEGSTLSGLMDSFAMMTSMALQYGVPLRVLCDKFSHVRFEPSGWSGNEQIGYARSIMDYLFRWMAIRFLGDDPKQVREELPGDVKLEQKQTSTADPSAPSCKNCGAIMERAGSCYSCRQCGNTSGCS